MTRLIYNPEYFSGKKRPQIEIFDECFDGKCCFGDLDFIVERDRKYLFVEFKYDDAPCTVAQRILLERLSENNGFTVVKVNYTVDENSKMNCHSYQYYKSGTAKDVKQTSTEELKNKFKIWDEVVTRKTGDK